MKKRMRLMGLAAIGAALVGVFLGGCAVGPNYHPPQTKMPVAWVAPPTTQASITIQSPVEVEQWWTTFKDPELDSLIHRAVEQNLDVQAAIERVRQARASVGIASSNLFPTVNAAGSYSRSFSAKGGSVVVTNTAAGTVSSVVGPKPQDLFEAGFDATWELDIFGGVRRSIEAADYTLAAAVESKRDTLLTVLGEVATDYITLRGDQEEVRIARENLASQVHTLDVTRKKVQGGTTTSLDVANAEAQVATTRSAIATFIAEEQQTIYALSVLLGQEPLALASELSPPGKIPVAPGIVPVGIPSDLLRRRPDIRQAERQLGASNAQVGVAIAQLFPQFSFSGTFNLQGSKFSALGDLHNRFWSFGPSFNWPIFDAGRIWSNVEVEKSLDRQALITYKSTVLAALQDVENQLTAYSQEQQRREALVDAVAANQRAVVLARQRYDQGLTDFLNVLVAEESLFTSQDALVQSDRNVGTDLVALYKALGGGWKIGEPTTQP